MKRTSILSVVALSAAACLTSGGAAAALVYSTGFEAPTYASGNLLGQEGWQSTFGQPLAVVQGTTVHSGAQAAQYAANQNVQLGQDDIGRFTVFDATNLQVTVKTSFLLSSSSSQSTWALGASQSDGSYDGGLVVLSNGSTFVFGGQSSATVSRNVWHDLSLIFDFGTSQYDVVLDGVEIASDAAMSNISKTFLTPLFTSVGGANANDSLFLDDLSISAVPEPTSIGLAGLSLAGLAMSRRRRRTA